MDSPAKLLKERIARTQAWLNEADRIGMVCSHVANGGSLIDLCKDMDIRYSDVVTWIYNDPQRRVDYENSIKARGEWFIQTILDELRRIGTVDIRQAFTEQGRLKPINEIPDDVARALAGIDVFEEFSGKGENRTYIGDTKKIKLFDKLRALELLGKNLHMFVDRVEHSGKVTLEDLVAGSQEGQTDGQEETQT